MGPTFNEQMQAIVAKYIAAGEPWPASTRQIAGWMIRNRLWEPSRSSMIDQCADQIARALREEHITDPQGRSVRAKHAARMPRSDGESETLWGDIRTASPEHMEIAFQQRRQQILGDCRQLKTDVDSFNENRKPEREIQMVFDFTLDLMELEAVG